MPEVITECTCGQLGVLEAAAGRLAVPVDGPCDACGAEAGEDCRPDCIGQAAHLDELGIDLTEEAGCTCCQVSTESTRDDEDECPRCGHLMKSHYRETGAAPQ